MSKRVFREGGDILGVDDGGMPILDHRVVASIIVGIIVGIPVSLLLLVGLIS